MYPAPFDCDGDEPELYAPSNPSIMSLAVVVLTLVTVGTAFEVLVATAGRAPFASHGLTVFAPETPKATIEASSVLPERFTVMLAELSCEAATAHHTSTSRYGFAPMSPRTVRRTSDQRNSWS